MRVNTGPLVLKTPEGAPFDLPAAVGSLMRAGSIGSWQVKAAVKGDAAVPGRIRALRKTREAIRTAEGKLKRDASRKGNQVQPDTVISARCVILFMTFPEPDFSARDVLERYRVRRQVEPVFKRFKSPAQSGRLPKYDDESAGAWLYGKILVALLTEKLIHHASAVLPPGTTAKRKRSAWCGFKFARSQIIE